MKAIRLLQPEYESTTKELQVFQWEATRYSYDQAKADDNALQWDALKVRVNDRSIPRPVYFAWKGIRAASKNLAYDLLISTDTTFKAPIVFKDITEPCRSVLNLQVGTRYFWKVIARERVFVLAVSPIWSFKTHASTPRWLHVPGITNVRDMGGWCLPGNRCIRQGLIYRSSEMNSHVNISDEGRRVLLSELKIRTDLDLRGSSEEVQMVLDQSVVKWINIPVEAYGYIVTDTYVKRYRELFKVFSDPSAYPIIFHCWGGCDRGGTVAFLLHALLGLDSEALFRDYELSSLTIWGKRSRASDLFQSLLSALMPFGDRKDNIGAQVEGYLRSIGVTAEEIASIRTYLTEEMVDR